MNVTRFEPWKLTNLLRCDLDQLAERRFGVRRGDENRVFDWMPAVDNVEEKDRGANGILEVRMPKQPEVQARRIAVEAA